MENKNKSITKYLTPHLLIKDLNGQGYQQHQKENQGTNHLSCIGD